MLCERYFRQVVCAEMDFYGSGDQMMAHYADLVCHQSNGSRGQLEFGKT